MASKRRHNWQAWSAAMLLALAQSLVFCRLLFPAEDAETGSGVGVLFGELLCGWLAGVYWLWFTPTIYRPAHSSNRFVTWKRGLPTWALGATTSLLLLSWLSGTQASYQFPAHWLVWEWLGVTAVAATSFLMGRYFGLGPTVALLVVVALGEAALALWEVAYEQPQLRQLFKGPVTNPELQQELLALGIEPGTPSEARFRDRLQSTEAFGTTGHPNTLAGIFVFILPFLLIPAWFSFFTTPHESKANSPTRLSLKQSLVWIVLASIVVIGLGLTKCRSAVLAIMMTIGFFVCYQSFSQRWRLRLILILLVLLGLLMILGTIFWQLGLLDQEVFSESGKSLRYRLEWWWGATQVIADRPWLGVGWGNFRSHYLQYKLPFSSEEIKEPHQFMLEIWSAAGVGALLAYIILLLLSVWGLWQIIRDMNSYSSKHRTLAVAETGQQANQAKSASSERMNNLSEAQRQVLSIWWRGLVAASFAFLCTQVQHEAEALTSQDQKWLTPVALFVLGLTRFTPIGFLIGASLLRWFGGRLLVQLFSPSAYWQQGWVWATVLALCTIHIHWLAAGGVSNPALLLLVWSTTAAVWGASLSSSCQIVPPADMVATPPVPEAIATPRGYRVRWAFWLVWVAVGGSALFCFWQFHWSALAARDRYMRQSRLTAALEPSIQQAIQAMPNDLHVWERWAQYHENQIWKHFLQPSLGEPHYEQARAAALQMVALDRQRAMNWLHLARLELLGVLLAHPATGATNPGLAAERFQRAQEATKAARDRYPHFTLIAWNHAALAWLQHHWPNSAGTAMVWEQVRTLLLVGHYYARLEEVTFPTHWFSTADESQVGPSSKSTPTVNQGGTDRPTGQDWARDLFRFALWLDGTPHPDKRLTPAQRQFAELVLGKTPVVEADAKAFPASPETSTRIK